MKRLRSGAYGNSAFAKAVLAAMAAIVAPHAQADILGFGDFSDFQVNKADTASGPIPTGTGIQITNRASNESRSIFHLQRQGVTEFEAAFTYRQVGTPTAQFGACFVVQNSEPFGPETVARPNVSGVRTRFGYSDFFGTFNRSVAVSLEHASLGAGSSSTGQYQNGSVPVPGGSIDTSPVNLFNGNPIDVTLSYNGTLLRQRLEDTVSGAVAEQTFIVDIPALVGDSLAYVGFVANTGTNTTTEQYISDFTFFAVPEPASLLTFLTLAPFIRRR